MARVSEVEVTAYVSSKSFSSLFHFFTWTFVSCDNICITVDLSNSALVAIRLSDTNGSSKVSKIQALRDRLGISSIEFIDSAGTFLVSTDYDATKIPNLFAMCASYRKLFESPEAIERTPLMPSFVDQRVHKFVLAPLKNNREAVSVGVRVNFMSLVFDTILRNDPSIQTVTLKTPSDFTLGVFKNKYANPQRNFIERVAMRLENILGRNSGFTKHFESLAYSPSVGYCCECEKKGLGQGPDGKFFYRIDFDVAKTPLVSAIARILFILLLCLALLIPVSWLISKLLADFLSRRLADLSRWTEAIMNDNNEAGSLRAISGTDEVAVINRRFCELLQQIRNKNKDLLRLEKQTALAELAAQVAHDIRSPLAALSMAEKGLSDLPEEIRLIIRSATSRIRDIANHLIEKNRQALKADTALSFVGTEKYTVALLSGLIEGILSEKRMQFRNKIGIEIQGNFDTASYGLFAKIQIREFKRVLSNLLNNSIEAMGEKGKVVISLRPIEDNQIQIGVRDNGKGIPSEVLTQLGNRGVTLGKKEGSGFGLFHARTVIEALGGKFELKSQVGHGAEAIIVLPKAHAPSWFVEELCVESNSTLVVLDDDESIHRIWQSRGDLARFRDFGITILHFSTVSEFRNWNVSSAKKRISGALYLMDFELLGEKETGLDLIADLGIAAQSVLVTSHYEEARVLERCLKLGVSLIPKGMAGFVPIKVKHELKMITKCDLL